MMMMMNRRKWNIIVCNFVLLFVLAWSPVYAALVVFSILEYVFYVLFRFKKKHDFLRFFWVASHVFSNAGRVVCRRAMWLNVPGLIILLTLCSLAGMVVYAEYRHCDPLSTRRIHASDQVGSYILDTALLEWISTQYELIPLQTVQHRILYIYIYVCTLCLKKTVPVLFFE